MSNFIHTEPAPPNWDQTEFVAQSERTLAEIFPPTCEQCRHDGKPGVPATVISLLHDYCDEHAAYHKRVRELAANPTYQIYRPTASVMQACLVIMALAMGSCTGTFMGLTRTERLIIYGDVLDVAGHPELAEPMRRIAKTLGKQPLENIQP